MKKEPWLKALALVILIFSSFSAPAAVIGYWRFESDPGFLEDSSGNGLTLAQGGTDPVTNPALAATGPTSDFFDPIPQTGQSNENVALFNTAASGTTSRFLSRSDSSEFDVTSFTFEALINRTSGNNYIASQWEATGNQRSWGFGVNSNVLFVTLSSNGMGGGDAPVVNSPFTMITGNDYYVAFSFDGGAGPGQGNVTFYLQNLTAGTPLQSATVASGLTGVHNSTGNFVIGNLGGSLTADWVGSIDEARLSNTVLSQSQLLASVPEPGTVALLILGGTGMMVFRRSRKS